MLVLSRKTQQQIQIGPHVTITILKVKGETVRIGIEAPRRSVFCDRKWRARWPRPRASPAMKGTRPSTPSGTSLPESIPSLAIPISRTGHHRADGAHAAIRLEGPAFIDDDLAGTFLQSRQQAAEHDGVAPGGEGFGDIAGIADAPVGDDRHAAAGGRLDGGGNRGRSAARRRRK